MMVSIEVVRGAPGLQEFQVLSDYAVGCFSACLVGWVCAGGCRSQILEGAAETRSGSPFNNDPTTVFRVLH